MKQNIWGAPSKKKKKNYLGCYIMFDLCLDTLQYHIPTQVGRDFLEATTCSFEVDASLTSPTAEKNRLLVQINKIGQSKSVKQVVLNSTENMEPKRTKQDNWSVLFGCYIILMSLFINLIRVVPY